MKKIFTLSLFFNAVLAGALVWNKSQPNTGDRPNIPMASPTVAASSPDNHQMEQKNFSWSQLESPDYRVYVRNLRQIGCPEPTVEAIVTADVDSAFRVRSYELQQKLADVKTSNGQERSMLEAELKRLAEDEGVEISVLLGRVVPEQVAAGPVASPGQQKNASGPIQLPLVLRDFDDSALNLTDQQKQIIRTLRDQFVSDVGGANQDPSDPAYLARWEKAQPETDEMLKTMLGVNAFQNYQLEALNSAK